MREPYVVPDKESAPIKQWGHGLVADLVFRIAIVGLFLFSAVLASMLWLNV